MNQTETLKAKGHLLRGAVRPKKKHGLRRASPKRQEQNKQYLKLRGEFLRAHPWCQIWLRRHNKTDTDVYWFEAYAQIGYVNISTSGDNWFSCTSYRVPNSQEIHHINGRRGKNFLDTSTWLACSRKEHRWLHDHPKEARALGLLK